MVYYDTFDPFFTLFAGLAILILGVLIVNRRAAQFRSPMVLADAPKDRSGQLLTVLSIITGLLIFALAGMDALI